MLDVMQGSDDGTMKERRGNNTCICIGFGVNSMRLGGVLEMSRKDLEAASRRLKHTLGRLKAASRYRSRTGENVRVEVNFEVSWRRLESVQTSQNRSR